MAIEQLTFNLPPVLGKVACPIRLYLLSQRRPQLLPAVKINELSQLPSPGKNQTANIVPDKLGEKKGGFTIRAASPRFGFVDNGRIPEDKRLTTVR
jgi:hypothetical protein